MKRLKALVYVTFVILIASYSVNGVVSDFTAHGFTIDFQSSSQTIPMSINQRLTDLSTDSYLNFTFTIMWRTYVVVKMIPSRDADYDLDFFGMPIDPPGAGAPESVGKTLELV